MDSRISFFTLSGYLVPGVVFITSSLPAILASPQGIRLSTSFSAWIQPSNSSSLLAFVLTLFSFGLLAVAYATGTFLADIYFLASREIMRKWFKGKKSDFYEGLLKHGNLHALLRSSQRAREAYALYQCVEIDLYAYAGRVRMMGASGLAIACAALIDTPSTSYTTGMLGVSVGLAMVAVSISRNHHYYEWVCICVAVISKIDESTSEDKVKVCH